MSVPAVYLSVILIWSTTPLGIKWSGEGVSFLFGVTGRMMIGLVVCLFLVALFSRRVRWHARALQTYAAAGFGMWASMLCVYWGAQYIPSGLISVLFGLTPIVTGWMAALWLGERAFSPFRLLGMLCGLAGLVVIFGQAPVLGDHAVAGIAAIVLSVVLHSLSAVWVKRVDARLNPLETTTGALMMVVPLYLLTWWLADGQWPADIPARAIGAILYLGVFGSVIGFVAYYYLLRHSQASRVALVTLVTPVMALLVGQGLNGEQIDTRVWVGAAIILAGLASYQWGDQLRTARLRARAAVRAGG